MESINIDDKHEKLLRRMYFRYNDDCEFGAPEVDPKRPYGNSDVYQDMIEILGFEEVGDGVFRFVIDNKEWFLEGEDKYNMNIPDDLKEVLLSLHKEMVVVLQIVCNYTVVPKGIYTSKSRYNWVRTDE